MATETKVIISGDSRGAVSAVKRLSTELGGLQALAAKAFSFSLFGGAASIGALVAFTKHIADTGDQLNKMSQKTGIAVEDLSKLQYAAELSGVSTEALQKGLTSLSVAVIEVADGKVSTASDEFKKFGINIRDAEGKIKSSREVLGELADRFAAMPDGVEKTNAAAAIFGKRIGPDLIPLLNGGSAGLKEMGDEAERLGIVMSGALAKKSEEFNDNLARMEKLATSAGISIGSKLIPELNEYLTRIVDAGKAGVGFTPDVLFGAGLKDVDKSIDDIDRKIKNLRSSKSYAAGYSLFGNTEDEIKKLEAQRAYLELQQKRQTGDGVASAEDLAAKRIAIEKKMHDQLIKLEQLRGIASGHVSADILETDDKRTAAQIKNAEALQKALSAAWQTSIKDAAAAGAEAQKLFAQAGDIRQTGADKAAALRRSQLSPEDQQAQIRNEFENAASSADRSADLATIARLHNRVEAAAKLTAQAEKDAERAAKFADQIDDPQAGARAIEQAAELQARLVEGRAAEKKNEQKQLEEQAAAQQAKLAEIDAQLTDLQTKAAAISVQADITAAEGQLASLQAQLDNIKDKTVTVTVNTVQTGAAPATPDDIPARAYGGVLPGWAPHDRADNMIYRGTPGEWVMQRRAVRHYGPDFMAALNAMRLPKYANGGLLGNLRMPSISSAAPSAPASSVTLNFPGMGKFPASMAPDVLGELQSAFSREALKKGARR